MQPQATQAPSTILRVFLSSTFVDLQAHRAAVRDIVGRLGQFTLAMEQFGARHGDAQTVSTDLVAGCDLYLGIVAWRYGFVPADQSDQPASVTQLEYEEAVRLGIPRLLFLADVATQAADGPDDLFPASVRDPEHLSQLLAFRAAIEQAQVVDYYTTPDDLAKKAAAALHHYLAAHPLVLSAAESAMPVPPHDLPPRAPGFVGRDGDLQSLASLLRQERREEGVAAAVVGMGGMGKSSLAAEAAYALAASPPPPAFPGGMTWVRCDDRLGMPGLTWIEDQLLAAWGAPLPSEAVARAATPEEGLELRERALRQRLRPRERESAATSIQAPALVLLDNVERDLPLPRLLDTVAPLGITTLLTCRTEPASPRVRLLRLEALGQDAGVHLFAERYTARGGSWDAARDEPIAQAIAEALGGLPLAIELAAARAARTRLSLTVLAEELRAPDALSRLSDPLDPSASVRYSLGKTVAALTPAQRVRFAALGLPDGPDWPQAIIERMLAAVPAAQQEDIPSAQADLEALVAYSLVGLVAASDGSGGSRVRLHPLVRELAREEWAQLPEDVQHSALEGLIHGVQSWIEAHRQDFDLLARDEDLVAGAVRSAHARRVALLSAIATVDALGDYNYVRNRELDRELLNIRLDCARLLGDNAEEVQSLVLLALVSEYLLQLGQELVYLREALPLARTLSGAEVQIYILGTLAAVLVDLGAVDEARVYYDEARSVIDVTDPAQISARDLGNLGCAAAGLGLLDEGVDTLRRALDLTRARGDRVGEAPLLNNLADCLMMRGDREEARARTEEMLALVRDFGYPQAAGAALDRLGELAMQAGKLGAAKELFDQALRESGTGEDVQSANVRAHVTANLAVLRGELARARGATTEAAAAYHEALALFEASPFAIWHMSPHYVEFARQRLTSLGQEQPTAESAANAVEEQSVATVEPIAVGASAPADKRRRWWPWGRR